MSDDNQSRESSKIGAGIDAAGNKQHLNIDATTRALLVAIQNLDLGIDIQVGHGKNLTTETGSHATITTESLVAAAGAGVKNKVVGIVFSTLVDTACVVQLTNGSGGTVLYEIELQASIVPGVVIPPSIIEICETAANIALHLKLSVAQKVSYTVIVDQSE